MANPDVRTYMGHLWVTLEDGIVTIGVHEEALEDFSEITSFDLPRENEAVRADEVCAVLETSDGPLDIYSPADGKVIEINSTIVEDPAILFEDPYGEGWILKIESNGAFALEEDDDDEEDEDSDEDFDEDDEDEDDKNY